MGKYGLIGQHIEQSMSPAIHRAIFDKLHQSSTYDLIPLSDFDRAIPALLASDYDGFNVTIPFKQRIMPYLIRLDKSAEYAGAVNTIKREVDGWVGYNTDGIGLIQSIENKLRMDDNLLIMGTGGAAYGIVSALVSSGYQQITCAGRNQDAMEALADHVRVQFDKALQCLPYSQVNLEHYQVIINATSVGMSGADQEPLIDFENINSNHLVVDIVYKPRVTPLLQAAQRQGARTIGGIHMLCAQALAAESIWQGTDLAYSDFEETFIAATEEISPMTFKAQIPFETQIHFYDSVSSLFTKVASLPYGRKLWLIDSKVYGLYAAGLHETVFNAEDSNSFIVIPSGEMSKTLQEASRIYSVLEELEWTKGDALVALGGGMVGDLTGYVAGTYLRGLPLVFIPTTLLSQLDSSIGGKVAVNTQRAKNQVGLYYPAKSVHMAKGFLETVPVADFESGLGELFKMLFLFDSSFVNQVDIYGQVELKRELEQLVMKAIQYKIDICQRDFMDGSERLFLNFGHTLGHAIEAELGYASVTHGKAVALGMLMITGYFEKQKKTALGTTKKMKDLFTRLGLELPVLTQSNRGCLADRLGFDKKRTGNTLTLVGIRDFGQPFLEDFPMSSLAHLSAYLEETDDFEDNRQ